MKLRSRDVPKPKAPPPPREALPVRLVRQSLAELKTAIEKNTAGANNKAVPYRFKIKRNKDGFIEDVIATPIEE